MDVMDIMDGKGGKDVMDVMDVMQLVNVMDDHRVSPSLPEDSQWAVASLRSAVDSEGVIQGRGHGHSRDHSHSRKGRREGRMSRV